MDHPHVTNLMESEHESSTPIQDENARSTQIPSSMDGIHGFSNSTPTSSGTPIGPTSSMKDDNATYNPKRLKSAVWEHFTREEICGEWKAICNYCKRMLGGKSRNGTTHLHDHLRRCASRTHKDPKQQLLLSKQNKVDGTTTLTNYAFNQTFARNELGRMIIMHEYPLSMVDHWGFRRYSSALQPIFNIPCRNTIRNDILKVYKEEKLKTMRMIEMNDSRVAITTDMWTADHQKKGYMALTAHFIDASWVLQKRILRFCYVPAPHTKEVIADELMIMLLDWGIDEKLSTITLDNCSVNDGVVNLLLDRLQPGSLLLCGKFFHMRCCAHILNLIVKDGLHVIGDGVDRIRESVNFWTATPKRIEKFEECARQLRVPTSKKLCLDCKTRWNSTYLMIDTSLTYKDVFSRARQRESMCKISPTETDWDMAKIIAEKLQLFYEVTEMFSGTKYPTANIYFPKICEIKIALTEWLSDSNVTIALMASRMLEKFDKYWSAVHGFMGIATVFDPRYKKCMLEYHFSKIYGDVCDVEIDRIECICRDLLSEYQTKYSDFGVGKSTLSSSTLAQKNNVTDGYDEFLSRRKSGSTQKKSEFDFYLEEDVLPRSPNFDILQWWKTAGVKYPMMQRIAKDLYAIPVSSVASECAFSTGGRLLSASRSRLHPTMVEALTCAQNWLGNQSEDPNTDLSEIPSTCMEEDDINFMAFDLD